MKFKKTFFVLSLISFFSFAKINYYHEDEHLITTQQSQIQNYALNHLTEQEQNFSNTFMEAPKDFIKSNNIADASTPYPSNCQNYDNTMFCETYDQCSNLEGIQSVIPFGMDSQNRFCQNKFDFFNSLLDINTIEDNYYSEKSNIDFTFTAPKNWEHNDYPLMIVVHGGGWIQGDKKEVEYINTFLAQRGFKVFSINYTLAKKDDLSTVLPRQMIDINNFISYLTSEKGKNKFKIYLSNISIMGLSAGGHLALYEAIHTKNLKYQCTVSIAGPTDLTSILEDQNNVLFPSSEHKIYMNDFLKNIIQIAIPDNLNLENFSVLQKAENINSNKIYFIHNEKDYLVNYSQSLKFFNKLQSKKNTHLFTITANEFEDKGHNLNEAIILDKLGEIIPNCY